FSVACTLFVIPERSTTPFLSYISALFVQNTGGGTQETTPILKSYFKVLTKLFRIRTYRRSSRFTRNQPKSAARNSFRFRTYRISNCNLFRIRTYEKTWGGGVLTSARSSRNVGQANCVVANSVAGDEAERRARTGEVGLAMAEHDGAEVESILINE